MDENNNTIVVIVGHSGSGKSTLAKALGSFYNCEVLGFSYAGRALAKEDTSNEQFHSINDYILHCIRITAQESKLTIVDGFASDYLIQRLSNYGFLVLTLFLDTPYNIRIQRMMEREYCSEQDAINLEHEKAMSKSKSGLSIAIQLADIRLNGAERIDEVVKKAINIIKERLSSV